MKDRVILLTSMVLVVTVALFAWFTWDRWGTVGIYPILGWLVVGSAFCALAIAVRWMVSRRHAQRTAPVDLAGSRANPGEALSEEPERPKVPAAE